MKLFHRKKREYKTKDSEKTYVELYLEGKISADEARDEIAQSFLSFAYNYIQEHQDFAAKVLNYNLDKPSEEAMIRSCIDELNTVPRGSEFIEINRITQKEEKAHWQSVYNLSKFYIQDKKKSKKSVRSELIQKFGQKTGNDIFNRIASKLQ